MTSESKPMRIVIQHPKEGEVHVGDLMPDGRLEMHTHLSDVHRMLAIDVLRGYGLTDEQIQKGHL